MKDWRRSPEPPSMMGLNKPYDHLTANSSSHYSTTDAEATYAASSSTLSDGGGPHQQVESSNRRSQSSLFNICKRVILRNISAVQDLGDMPYPIAKDILEQCRADQLVTIEEASPHLLQETELIWKKLCLRDFGDLRKRYEEEGKKGPKSWRRLYFRKKGEIEEQKAEAAQRIKDRYASHRAEKDAKKLVVSDKILGRPRGAKRNGWATTTSPATKGQSLIMKARSGSKSQIRLTTTVRTPLITVGKSKAVANRLVVPSSATMERPMVAPKGIIGSTTGLRDAFQWTRISADDKEAAASTCSSSSALGKQKNSTESTTPKKRTAAESVDRSVLIGKKPSITATSTLLSSSSLPFSSPSSSSSQVVATTTETATAMEGVRKPVIDFFGKRSAPISTTTVPSTLTTTTENQSQGQTRSTMVITAASSGVKRQGTGTGVVTVTTSKVAKTTTTTPTVVSSSRCKSIAPVTVTAALTCFVPPSIEQPYSKPTSISRTNTTSSLLCSSSSSPKKRTRESYNETGPRQRSSSSTSSSSSASSTTTTTTPVSTSSTLYLPSDRVSSPQVKNQSCVR